jgi:UDP-glucose 4-epimerase
MKKILLTGVSGFIGSNLIEELVKENQVIGMDKKPSSFVNDNFNFIQHDVKKIDQYLSYMKDINTIYHLAAASDIQQSLSNPTFDLEDNVIATHAILELMRKLDIPNIVFTSTSVVHGVGGLKPVAEDEVDFKPISQYAASKIACEAFIHAYSYIYGLKGWIFRLGNVVGKHEHRGVVYDFINKLKQNQNELEILGDGKQVKSYIHVSDIVNAITWIPENVKNKGVNIFNIATYDQVTVNELADIVCKELNVKPKYKYTGGKSGWIGDVPQIVMSIKKATSVGWKPNYKCEEAIRKAVSELK